MEAIELLKESEQMIKELQDAYVSHDGATALRRKIRKFVAAQHTLAADVVCTCAHRKDGAIMVYSKTCPIPNHAAKANR